MCGIAGVFYMDRDRRPELGVVERMTSRLSHRGPDDEAFHIDGGIGLGFRRLSIIDLAGGRQPFISDDGKIVSACNGEIYNWYDIRENLEKRGHTFKSRCDTEVVLYAYREYGPGFVEQFNGQFAYAVYDGREHKLILGRDQVGIAPMFYSVCNGAVVFASEIKAILEYPDIEKKVDLTALDQIFSFPGLISPHTMFDGIYSVKPGHFVEISSSGIKDIEYWDLIYPEKHNAGLSEDEAVLGIEEALRQAVKYRLQADVPVGFYLSGGLDSSLVGAIIHDLAPDIRRHSFSIGFSNPEIDERRFQRIIAQQTGSFHHEVEFFPDDVNNMMAKVIHLTECPLKETYDVCSLKLSGLVREHGMKVVQTGEGADELFAGYVGYRMDSQRENPELEGIESMMEADIRHRLWGDSDLMYERNFLPFREIKEAIYHPELADQLDTFECTNEPLVDTSRITGRHPLHKRSYLDFKLRLADHLLSDHGDRMAYGSSVEARYPFLDFGVVQAAVHVPPDYLIKDGCEKYVLRQVAQRYLPPEIMKREKFSFVAPGSPYLIANNIEWVGELLDPATIGRQGYFNPDTITRLKEMYSREGFVVNQTFDNDLLMIVLTFGLFLREFGITGR
ncbi:MAG: asparagine synthase (glutamine-hydrolyzing) [Candidatus Latescibacteria bacterium]|nr:asparagine synthase (glutamine-hydrolyzing) [Candidatus Latescibacterota bacterium]